MVESGGENFEGLLMGDVSETTSESDEQFAQRVAAAQARLAKVQKDEKKSKSFDQSLAQLIPELSHSDLTWVLFFINHGITSLSILALLSLNYKYAYDICYKEFSAFVEERADFQNAGIGNQSIQDTFSWWWTFIIGSNHISSTIHFSDLRNNADFVRSFSEFITEYVHFFIDAQPSPAIDYPKLQSILDQYRDMLFKETPAS